MHPLLIISIVMTLRYMQTRSATPPPKGMRAGRLRHALAGGLRPSAIRNIVRFGASLITADNARRGIIALTTSATKRRFCAILALPTLTQNRRFVQCCFMSQPLPLAPTPPPPCAGLCGLRPPRILPWGLALNKRTYIYGDD